MAKPDKSPAQSLLIPIVGLCVLLLGGLGFLYVMFSSNRDHKLATTPEAKVEKAPVVSVSRSAPSRSNIQSIDDEPAPAPEKPAPPPEKKPVAETKAPEPEPEKPVAAPEKPAVSDTFAAAPVKKPDGDPYMVPENKPFIDRDTFGGTKPKAPAVAAGGAAAPAAPAAPRPPPEPVVAPPPPPPQTAIQNNVYVLFSGRKISAVSTIDMGDSYGIKDSTGNFIKVKKADVSNVIKP